MSRVLMQSRLRKCCDVSESNLYSPFGRVGLSGPERALPGRYRVRPSRKRQGGATSATSNSLSEDESVSIFVLAYASGSFFECIFPTGIIKTDASSLDGEAPAAPVPSGSFPAVTPYFVKQSQTVDH